MSKCLKCGSALPPVGDCPTCATATQSAARAVPSLLDKEIHIDRRRPDRDASMAPAAPPGMTARAPVPPGMTPAAQTPRPPASAPAQAAAPRAPGLPVMPPRPQQPPAAQQMAPGGPHAVAQAQAQAPQQASAPGVPVMPPRPQAASGLPNVPPARTAAPAPPQVRLDEGESFSVDVEESEPTAPPVAPVPARLPATPAPAPVMAASKSGGTEVHARPASLWRRLLAFGIDTGAIAGIAALYLMLASSVAGVQAAQTGLTGVDALVIQVRALQSVLVPGAVLLLVLSLVYCAVFAFLWNGRTLGRRLLGLRLVDTHGFAPAPGRAILRAMLASLSFGLFLAGFWMALFDRRGQTLHDKLTSTYVVQPS
ncbi:MAG: RDD family protein [Archangium sp.]